MLEAVVRCKEVRSTAVWEVMDALIWLGWLRGKVWVSEYRSVWEGTRCGCDVEFD